MNIYTRHDLYVYAKMAVCVLFEALVSMRRDSLLDETWLIRDTWLIRIWVAARS